jgi:hypothetical protein
LQDRKSTLPDSLTLGREPSALYHGRSSTSISCEQPLLGSTLGIPVDLRLNRSRGPHRPIYRSRFCLVNRTEPWDTPSNRRLWARITCPDVGTKVLVRGGPSVGWRTGVGCSAPGHLHTAPSFCRAHGNVILGGPAGALVSSPLSSAALNAQRAPRWGRVARKNS